MNDPVRRIEAVSIAIASEATASTARKATSPAGCQSEACEVSTTTTSAVVKHDALRGD